MTRHHRRFEAGYPAHVVHRGNNGEIVFRQEADFRVYWACLKEAVERCGVDVNAYVFMSNHVHLLLTPSSHAAISRAMHSVSRRYARYFNARYGRKGTLWQERFFASLITTDKYLLACHRYIDMNPVRAGMAVDPASYDWSSHRCHALGEDNPLVSPHRTLVSLAGDGP